MVIKQENGGYDNIKDELEEFNKLTDCTVLIGEYVPFGANNVYEFCNKLDATKRVKSAMLTEYIDRDPKGVMFKTDPILTKVEITNFIEHQFIEFISEIFYPEEEGIDQIEKFGVRIDSYGRVVYGLKLTEVQGDPIISVDKLTRVTADLVQDSSRLLNSLLTNHQRELLNLVYYGNSPNRDKYIGIMASKIDPDFDTMDKYLDSGPYENELKQILEYVGLFRILPDGSKVFIGTHGLLFVSPNYRDYENIVAEYVFMKSVHIFLSNFFSRIWILEEQIKNIRSIFKRDINKDPTSSARVQSELTDASYNCILLEETLGFLQESIDDFKKNWKIVCRDGDDNCRVLSDHLQIRSVLDSCDTRIKDAAKITAGVTHEINGLREQIDVFNEKRLQSIFQQLKAANTVQAKTQRIAEHQNSKMKVLEIIMSGSLALSIMTSLVGEYSFVGSGTPYFNNPIAWFGLNLVLWIALSTGIALMMRGLQDKAEKMILVKVNFERRINLDALQKFLERFEIIASDIEDIEEKMLRTIKFTISGKKDNPFDGHEVDIEMMYDAINGFLYSVDMEVNLPKRKEEFFKNTLVKEFEKINLFE